MSKLHFKNWWLLSAFIFLGCNSPERKLNSLWPGKKNFLSPALVREGYILTKNNDTLKGYINVDAEGPLDHVALLPSGKTKRADIISVKPGGIDYLRMKFPSEKDSTDFMPIPIKPLKGKQVKPSPDKFLLYQILGRKNQMRLCYYEWGSGDADGNTNYMGELILVLQKDSIKILRIGTVGVEKTSRFLLQFINKRYGQHFKKTDLKDVKARIDYILDRENEKQLSR